MDTQEAASLGDGMLEIRDARCPVHGRVRPEMLAFPFSIDANVLVLFQQRCGGRGCEEDIVVDAVVTHEHLSQHCYRIVDESGPRMAIWAKQLSEDGSRVYRIGTRIIDGVLVDDHPSGALG